MKHECVIGMLHNYDNSRLITVSELKDYIRHDIIEFNAECRKHGLHEILHKEWSLKDYADKRKGTNLSRFNFCPMCGNRIDWNAIRKE